MKKITVRDKTHIKQLLYDEWVLGIKDDQFRSFGGNNLRLCACPVWTSVSKTR